MLKFERERVAERPQQSEDAYELYQHGMWHHYRHTREDNVEAQSYFRRALAIDAEYPQAAAALTIAVLNAGFLGWTEHAEANFAEAYELGQSAIHLDPHYPNAHYALGLVCMWTQRIDRAIAALEEAISLNPSFAAAHVLLAQMYLYAGRRREAIKGAEKGMRLSPSDPRLFIWLPALAGCGRAPGCGAICRRSGRTNPTGGSAVTAGFQRGDLRHPGACTIAPRTARR